MKKHIIAFTERVTATFLFTFIGVVVATPLPDTTALKVALIAGGLSVAKYVYTLAGAYLATPDIILETSATDTGSTVVPDPVPAPEPVVAPAPAPVAAPAPALGT